MSIFVHTTAAPAAKSAAAAKIAIGTAAIMVMLAVAQLFTFEDFPEVVHAMALPGVNRAEATVLAALTVVAEVFAVPFLLRMMLSPAMRIVSMALGWLVGLWWLAVATLQTLQPQPSDNIGLLGATVELPAEVWSLLLVMSIGVLIVWASWGLWPIRLSAK